MSDKNNTYPLFVQWYQTLDWILTRADKMPKNTRFTFGNRICQLALENIELITEAVYTRNRNPLLYKINMNIEKLRVFFRIAYGRNYITERQYQYISDQLNEAGKQCGGWIKNTR